ncbi:MAG: tetratricopeptide repeat protein [Verrucomicrobiota bacterium]|nr:tetratricopeptide repeat protein [Verrucomicrobiota bacterium]
MKQETRNSGDADESRARPVASPVSRLSRRTRGLAVLAVALGLAANTGRAAQPARDLEPVVTLREAAALNDAAAIAATNAAAAAAFLEKQDLAKAGAALDFALGNFHFQAEHYAAAEKAYEAALVKLPKFRLARANLGRVCFLLDKPDKTAKVLQSLVEDGQADSAVLVLLGHTLLLMGHALSAENAYRQALLLTPVNPDALMGLCKALLIQERHREALALVKELLSTDSRRRELWSLRANAHLALDQPEQALVSLECARRLNLTGPDMMAVLGDLYLNRQQPDDASACYQRAFASANLPVARALRAVEGFLMANEPDHAGRILLRLADARTANPELFSREQRGEAVRLRGDLARLQGDRSSALEIYTQALQDNPLDARTLIAVGDLRREAGELEKAVMAYERAARVPGFEARALARQAQVDVQRERYRQAVELLERAQALDEQPNARRYLEQVRRLAAIESNR